MFDPRICALAERLGVAPETLVSFVGVAKAFGYRDADAVATAYLHCADPAFDVYVDDALSGAAQLEAAQPVGTAGNLCTSGGDRNGDAGVQLERGNSSGLFANCGGKQRPIIEVPDPSELTTPEEYCSRSSNGCALRAIRRRSNAGEAEANARMQSKGAGDLNDTEGA